MKKYEKPLAEIIEFVPEDDIMNNAIGSGPNVGGNVGSTPDEDIEW